MNDDRIERYELTTDVVESVSAVQDMDEQIDKQPLFEPRSFVHQHGPLQSDSYKLSSEELRNWAEKGSTIRMKFDKKADILG